MDDGCPLCIYDHPAGAPCPQPKAAEVDLEPDELTDAEHRAALEAMVAEQERYPIAWLPDRREIYRRRHPYYGDLYCLGADSDGAKSLPDGREIVVLPWSGNGGQLSIGRRTGWYDDTWNYELFRDAVLAAEAWDGTGEPTGWYRHPDTGRRRPGGDPAQEFIRP